MLLLDNHTEAEIMQADAVALSKIVHGGEHVHTLVGVKKLAMMKEKSNKWTDAEILYKEAWYYHNTLLLYCIHFLNTPSHDDILNHTL